LKLGKLRKLQVEEIIAVTKFQLERGLRRHQAATVRPRISTS
jgi:hypothetical protein